MPQRSRVKELPPQIRKELNKRLIENSFSDYVGLAEWLNEQGYEISKSSVHRHGQELEKNLEAIKIATEQAKEIANTIGDDENALGDALGRLAQQKTFQALLALEHTEDLNLVQLTRAIADLNRSSISMKKFRSEFKQKIEAKLKELDSEKSEGTGKIDPKTLEIIRKEIYGIL